MDEVLFKKYVELTLQVKNLIRNEEHTSNEQAIRIVIRDYVLNNEDFDLRIIGAILRFRC